MSTDTLFDSESDLLSRTRVRASDPLTSHLAADKSAKGLSKLRVAILRMMFTIDRDFVGNDLNATYAQWSRSDPDKYPNCHPDSPRKRAGELAEDGYLDVVETREGLFGSPESVYRLSPEGRKFIERVASND